MLVLFLSVAAAGPLPQLEDAGAALDEAKRLEDLLSNYKPDSDGAGSASAPPRARSLDMWAIAMSSRKPGANGAVRQRWSGDFEAEGDRSTASGRFGQQHLRLGGPPSLPPGRPVDIRDPWKHEKTLTTVYLKDTSMSTPAQGSAAVSVVMPRSIDVAKPYFINGRRWAAEHKPKDFRIYFCEDRRDQPCAWLQ